MNYYKKTKIREEYNSLVNKLDRETDSVKRRSILEKIDDLRKGFH